MQVFIGVLIAGGRNWKKLHISEMWTENELFKQPYFTAVLSKNRFKEIYMQLEMTELKQLETNWKRPYIFFILRKKYSKPRIFVNRLGNYNR
jgi:hypothetical protein